MKDKPTCAVDIADREGVVSQLLILADVTRPLDLGVELDRDLLGQGHRRFGREEVPRGEHSGLAGLVTHGVLFQ